MSYEVSISAVGFMRRVGSQPSGTYLMETQENNRKISTALLMFSKC